MRRYQDMIYIVELSNYNEASDTSGVPVIIYKGSDIKVAGSCFDYLKECLLSLKLNCTNQFLCLSFLEEKGDSTIEIDYYEKIAKK